MIWLSPLQERSSLARRHTPSTAASLPERGNPLRQHGSHRSPTLTYSPQLISFRENLPIASHRPVPQVVPNLTNLVFSVCLHLLTPTPFKLYHSTSQITVVGMLGLDVGISNLKYINYSISTCSAIVMH